MEAFRHKQSMELLYLSSESITDYVYDARLFKLPNWLQVPPEIHTAQNELHKSGLHAINCMRALMAVRDTRYNALCPETVGVTYHVHVSSMNRLREWKEDMDTFNKTLAPAPKIPREALSFHVDPLNYGLFTDKYLQAVHEFMGGPYQAWRDKKSQVESLAARLIDNNFHYMEWRRWWQDSFIDEMWKWEVCTEGLIMPTWEDIIDEVYLLIIDRVEDAEDLAESFSVSTPRSLIPL